MDEYDLVYATLWMYTSMYNQILKIISFEFVIEL